MRKRASVLTAALIVLLGAAAPLAAAHAIETSPAPAGKEEPAESGYKPPMFYFHISAGGGVDWMGSSAINDFMSPYKLGGFGFNYFAGIRLGFRNIAQYERRADGGGMHDFHGPNGSSNNMSQATPKIDLFKFNPLFWTALSYAGETINVFLVYGKGKNAHYWESQNVGWGKGDVNIYGLEAGVFEKFAEIAVSLDFRTVQYDSFDMAGYGSVSYSFKASFIVFAIHIGFGLGF